MRTWLKGLAVAVIGGSVSTLSVVYAIPESVHFDKSGLLAMCKIAAAGAIISGLAYLKQSPLPPEPK